jgi:hypothetical protein
MQFPAATYGLFGNPEVDGMKLTTTCGSSSIESLLNGVGFGPFNSDGSLVSNLPLPSSGVTLKAGTPLMLAALSSAIDLVLNILIWEDGHGKVWVSHNSQSYLKERHGLPQELLQNITVVETLAAKAGE